MEQQQVVEAAQRRCLRVIHTIQNLLPCAGPGGGTTIATTSTTNNKNITESCKCTLLKLAESELHFLSSSSSTNLPPTLSVNIGHVEAVLHILRQPLITAVSRVCKPIAIKDSKSRNSNLAVHVDIVCTFNKNPVWIIVSDRNPKYLSWFLDSKRSGNKGLKSRLQQLLGAAQSTVTMKPCSIVLFFSHGVTDFVNEKLRDEFGASKLELEFDLFDFDLCEEELEGGEWINVVVNARSFKNACVFEIKIDSSREHAALGPKYESNGSPINNPAEQELKEELTQEDLSDGLCCLISGMKLSPLRLTSVDFVEPGVLTGGDDGGSVNLINFDTTALIAIVSGISNGCCEKLLATSEVELRRRFKGNYEFVISQVMSEIQNPIFGEVASIVRGKRGIICESVLSEFKELVSLCGGPNEKLRADKILKRLMVVPDSPSERMMSLPTTRKLALKNKVVFGTGDYWHAPTLTANMAFVRAVSQTAMSLFTIEHRPRALTGD